MKAFMPTSVVKMSRAEINETELEINRLDQANVTTLPEGLAGHVFIVAPLSPREDAPYREGERSFPNGDGMIYRLSFVDGKATLKTAIARTPCYYADLATQYLSEYKKLRFRNGGVTRLSVSLAQVSLGSRNQLNTAFLKTNHRLFVTYDAGRPYTIDPKTLEIVEPLGTTKEWISLLPLPITQVFDAYSNSAHPVCDPLPNTSEVHTLDEGYIVNYSPGYNGKFSVPVNRAITKLFRMLNQSREPKNRVDQDKKLASNEIWGSFTDLIRYQSCFSTNVSQPEYELERWRLRLPNGEPVLIKQSVHQMGLTKDYVILGDLSFGLEYSQIFSPYILGFLWIPRFKNFWFSTRFGQMVGAWVYRIFLQLSVSSPFTDFYVIRRDPEDPNEKSSCQADRPPKMRTAIKISIPRTVSHFAVDYDNPDDKLTFHIGHHNGLDPTEWINKYDEPVQSPQSKGFLRKDLAGLMVGTTDLGSFGRYVFDAKTGTLLNSSSVSKTGFLMTEHDPDPQSKSNTWLPSVYSHRDLTQTKPQVKYVYWMSWGFSWELIPQRIYDAYRDRPYREMPLASLPSEDMPPTLLCLDTDQMEISDAYAFPEGHAAFSPQFVPNQDEAKPGFIVCVVLTDIEQDVDRPQDQFWIFEAGNLSKGPVCKLHHPDLDIGLTLHSIWLSHSEFEQFQYAPDDRHNRRRRSVYEDYEDRISRSKEQTSEQEKLIKKLFDENIYGNYIEQTSEEDLIKKWTTQENS